MSDRPVKKIRNARIKVVKYLSMPDTKYKDSDLMLTARWWFDEIKEMGKDPSKISATELLTLYGNNKLISAELIARARRQAQFEDARLRGDSWSERHAKMDDTRMNIHNPNID